MISHHGGVAEPVTWYSNSGDRFHALRTSGGPLIAVVLLPVVIATCAGTGKGTPTVFLLLGSLVLLAVLAALGEFLRDQRKVVEMRLAGGALTVMRANGSTRTYARNEVEKIEVTRHDRAGGSAWITMRVEAPGRVEITRAGPARLPDRWDEEVAIAEIEVTFRDKSHSSD
jgi:hypothetical protein